MFVLFYVYFMCFILCVVRKRNKDVLAVVDRLTFLIHGHAVGHVTRLARLSVRLSVCPSVPYVLITRKLV